MLEQPLPFSFRLFFTNTLQLLDALLVIKTTSLAPMEAASFFFFLEKDTADSGTKSC